jgi:phage recombination protein Bet
MVTQQQQPPKQNLPVVAPPRLPYDPRIKERFGVDASDWKAIVEAIFPSAKTSGAVVLALAYCKATRKDIFKRCVHIVPIWDKERRCEVETVWPGIADHRTTAFRTGLYAGHDEIKHGPMISRTWADGDGEVTVEFPEWSQLTVYRFVHEQRCAFPGPVVYWLETYAAKKNDAPNAMWRDRPIGMIDKCAEAGALRGAFPEELGDEFTESEASSRFLSGRAAVVVEEQQQQSRAAQVRLPSPTPTVDFAEQAQRQESHVDAAPVEPDPVDHNSEPVNHEQPEPEVTDDQRIAEVVEECRVFLEDNTSVIECKNKAEEIEAWAKTNPWFGADAVEAVKAMAKARIEKLHNQRGQRSNGGK